MSQYSILFILFEVTSLRYRESQKNYQIFVPDFEHKELLSMENYLINGVLIQTTHLIVRSNPFKK